MTAEAWDRQKGESRQAYEAFRTYRDQGATRSNANVARQLGKSKTLMDRWSARHGWVWRAERFDAEQDREHLEWMRSERRDMARRHARLAQAMQAKLVDRLQAMDPDQLSPHAMAAWLDVAARVERQAVGASEVHELVGAGGGPIQLEHQVPDGELELLQELAAIHTVLSERLGGGGGDDDDQQSQPSPRSTHG